MNYSLKTATLALGIAALLGSASMALADSTDTTSSKTTTTTASAPAPAVVYAAPVVVAAPAAVVVAPMAPAPSTTKRIRHLRHPTTARPMAIQAASIPRAAKPLTTRLIPVLERQHAATRSSVALQSAAPVVLLARAASTQSLIFAHLAESFIDAARRLACSLRYASLVSWAQPSWGKTPALLARGVENNSTPGPLVFEAAVEGQ